MVFEVLSPGNRVDELLRKFRFYEKYGVEEYYIYNPENGDLFGWRRRDGGLEEITEMNGHVSLRLGIRFEPGDGPDNLKISGPDGQPFRTHQELMDQADAERQRGDLLWYPQEGQPKVRLAPDVMVAFGRPKGYRGSYKQWEENAVAPHVVFEVLSPGNRVDELLRKFRFYEKYGVVDCCVCTRRMVISLDGDVAMAGWKRSPIEQPRQPATGNPLRARRGARTTSKIIGPDGQPFRTHQELMDQAETERQRAETERSADAERQR